VSSSRPPSVRSTAMTADDVAENPWPRGLPPLPSSSVATSPSSPLSLSTTVSTRLDSTTAMSLRRRRCLMSKSDGRAATAFGRLACGAITPSPADRCCMWRVGDGDDVLLLLAFCNALRPINGDRHADCCDGEGDLRKSQRLMKLYA